MQQTIYLDYMATTPVDPHVVKSMMDYLGPDTQFGNPASQTHRYGWAASQAVGDARAKVAALLNADPREIIWTSGATEADNLAIKGIAQFYQRKGRHIITMLTEHKAVLDACRYLETQGFEVTYLTPQNNGVLDLDVLKAAIRDDTILVSIMHVNNETGVVQDIAAIAELVKQYGIVFHSDAAQSAGKIELDVQKCKVDLLSLSSHKIYGPKGMGALFVRRQPRVRLMTQMHGGGHEQGLRSGTLPTHQIVGMGEAFAIAKQNLSKTLKHNKLLGDRLWELLSQLEHVELNGDLKQRVPHCLNISFAGVDNETLLMSLPEIAVSSGSACNSAEAQPSHVLLAMGLSRERAQQAIRFSLGRFTTLEDVEFAATQVVSKVKQLRELSPLWKP